MRKWDHIWKKYPFFIVNALRESKRLINYLSHDIMSKIMEFNY